MSRFSRSQAGFALITALLAISILSAFGVLIFVLLIILVSIAQSISKRFGVRDQA